MHEFFAQLYILLLSLLQDPTAWSLFVFGIVSTARSTSEAISEAVLVRDVPDEVMNLTPDVTPFLIMSMKAKRRRATVSPRVEKIEDDIRGTWAVHVPAAISSAATGILVNDGTLFAIGDLISVPKTASSAAAEEIVRVTAISSNTLTVTRGVGGAGADPISASNAPFVIHPPPPRAVCRGAVLHH